MLSDARRRGRAGFSLIELLVAAAAMGVVIFFALGSFTVQHRTYVVVDQVAETQQNTRAIAALVERDVRNAGYVVPPSGAACGVDRTDAADELYLSDADAIAPIDTLDFEAGFSELGAQITAAGAGTTRNFTVDDVVIDETPTYDTDSDGVDDSDFQVGGGAIVAAPDDPTFGIRCGRVTAVGSATTLTVVFGADPGASLAGLRLVPAHLYRIVDPGGGAPPELHRDGILLAKDVEDLQAAWFYDANGDGQTDAGEYWGVAGNDLATGPLGVVASDLREIRFNLVVRASADDPGNPNAASTGQFLENRATNVPGDDGRRRRVHTSTIRVRNVST